MLITIFLLSLLIYCILLYPQYLLLKKAGIKNPGIIFIPIFGILKICELIDYPIGKAFLIIVFSFIPIVGLFILFIFYNEVYYSLFKHYSCSNKLSALFTSMITFQYIIYFTHLYSYIRYGYFIEYIYVINLIIPILYILPFIIVNIFDRYTFIGNLQGKCKK